MSKTANYLHMMNSPMVTDLLTENRRLKEKIETLHEVIQMCLLNTSRRQTRAPLRRPPSSVPIKIEPGLEVVSDLDDEEEASDDEDDSDIVIVEPPPQKKENIIYQLEEESRAGEAVQAGEEEAQSDEAQAGEEEEAGEAQVDEAQSEEAQSDEEEEQKCW